MATPSAESSKRASTVVDDEPVNLRIGQYTRLNEIGRGSFATVYRGTHNEYNTFVAVKSVTLLRLTKKLRDNLKLEIDILKSLHHPHIVALIDCYETSSHIHIIMEFCMLGDLSRFIKKRNSMAKHELLRDMMTKYPNPPGDGLHDVVVRHFLKQLASALQFLRAKDLIHRDVKPQNLLLHPSPVICSKTLIQSVSYKGSENSFTPIAGVSSFPMLKIADFGFARSLPSTSLADTLCGSPLYMAPEILRYEKYDAKADLWSVGTVLYEMVVGKPPFRASNHMELLQKIQLTKDRIKFPRDTPVASDIKKLIRSLLKFNPVERLTFPQFFESPVVECDIPGLVGEDLEEQIGRNAAHERERLEGESLGPEGLEQEVLDQPGEGMGEDTTVKSADKPLGSTAGPPVTRPGPRPVVGRVSRPSSAANQGEVREKHDTQPTENRQHEGSPVPASTRNDHPVVSELAVRQRSDNQRSSISSLTGQISGPPHSPRPQDAKQLSEVEMERAAQDIAFERDYVVVEKRAVEVNAFADELAASPRLRQQQLSSRQAGAIIRRATTTATPHSLKTKQTTQPDPQDRPTKPKTDSTHNRRYSYDRRYGPNPISATSAISKALNMASGRLFGVSFSPPSALTKGGRSPPLGYNPFPSYPVAQSSLVVVDEKPQHLSHDSKTVHIIEECATRSDVVYGFAEVKYKQLIPAAPSSRSESTIKPANSEDGPDEGLTLDAVLILSEEALVLYVKALSILAKAMDIAGAWWARKNRDESISNGFPISRTEKDIAVSSRINNVVQWVRTRFNEVLQKAEYSRRRLLEAQKQLPPDHPYRMSHELGESESLPSFDQSSDQVIISSGITAEKLMYDRALEMSRTAAINELTGEDLSGCEIAYVTAIRMLEAVLESDDTSRSSKERGAADGGSSSEPHMANSQIQGEDCEVVAKLVESIRARLRALRKKMSLMAKRTSAPPAVLSPKLPPSHPRPASPAMAHSPSK
ncbi:Serine/threonine-protein kinase [Microsporum canis]|uniref:Serine/threonine-protein kinase ATG1 n=1 Tax=Arthroderma otae (strain ATCC MYA-4605 / CBS 113480) TaxID=554155 RepID=C5FSB3_ARTOC|nr:serine/threonine-protein kinase unc-51 [Microsporum canis CBS 113480]EEQ32766.1 serine/threonine-protein kinase unc-51 [Microsporum canis CBS 113480]